MNTESLITTIIILAILPLTIIIVWFFIQNARHKERMLSIEKGLNITPVERKDSPFQDVLMWGMLAGGTGVGLLIAYILLESNVLRDDMILGILSVLFGGISLIGYHLLKLKKRGGGK